MNAWQRLDNGEDKTDAGFRTVTHKRFVMNSGETMQADIIDIDGHEAACVVALTPENDVIIARQFRCGPEMVMDEIPGGLIDEGETPEQAIRRELLEEAGYEPGTLKYMGKAYLNAWSNTVHHYFLAEQCQKVSNSLDLDMHEEIEVANISIPKLIENAKNAQMTDVQAVLFCYDRLKELEKIPHATTN